MRVFMAAALTASLSFTTQSLGTQRGRAMTIDDLIAAVRVTDPQLSPDGSRVIFVRTTTDVKSGDRNADIWTVPADGSGPAKELIAGNKTDNTPRFSPDGRSIAFISSRDGAPQVYVSDPKGGNVRRVTNLSVGVQPPLVFSPDGSRIAVVSDVYPECSDEACNKRRSEEEEKNPVTVHHLTRLLYRHWDEWRANIRHHIFVADVESRQAIDVTPGDVDSPPGQQEDGAISFSPDGREIAFASNREGGDREAWTTNHDIWIVPSAGGSVKKVTTNPASDLQPLFSPDGRTLFVRAQRRPGFESDRWYLDAYDRSTGTKRTVFTSPDISATDYALSPDGSTIWFTAAQQGHDDLFSVPSAGGVPLRVSGGVGSVAAPRPGSAFVVVSRSSLNAPAEIFRVSVDGKSTTALTHENGSWLKDVAFG
jgi:Tol biopolymer transport system component